MKYSLLVKLSLLSTVLSCGIDPDVSLDKEQEDSYEFEFENDSGGTEDIAEDTESDAPEDTGIIEDPILLADFSQVGPYTVRSQSRSSSVTGCSIDYVVYSPNEISSPPTVIVGHGFARGSGVMTGWAEHLSSWGVEVLLPTLCHYNVWLGVDHETNGLNMKELASLHGASEVVYVGHSAGGLAAIIAASIDESAIGVLGLDATDTEGVPGVEDYIGRDYASSVNSTAYGIVGEPSSCNSNNNGLTLFRMMPEYKLVKVTSSDHCDFENPTDAICTMSCENSSVVFGDSEIQSAIITLGTAAVMSLTGLSPESSLWWSEEGLGEWINSGLIQEME